MNFGQNGLYSRNPFYLNIEIKAQIDLVEIRR